MASADVEAATALKVKGNKAFAEHDWPGAVDFYTQAIEKYDKDPSFWCNRAQAGLRRRWARDHPLIRIGKYQA
jgi:serine/threonine-protein phosphatase 5